MRLPRLLAGILLATLVGLAPAQAQKRVALVIGNGTYGKAARLPNPVRDAQAVAALLKSSGFDEVEAKNDLDLASMQRALRDFSVRARDADVAVVFFAGHGIEVNGANYLIPVDATLERDIDVEDETISLDRVSQLIAPARRLRLIILDACRDNPFAPGMKRTMASRSIGRGLGRIEVLTPDTMIAFAARAGSTAGDGSGPNSPYTAALLAHLATPGLDVRLALGRVRDDVVAATAGKQEPFVYGSLGGAEVALRPGTGTPSGPAPAAATDPAERAWSEVRGSTSMPVLEEFVRRFGDSFYATLARSRIAELKVATVAPPAALPAPSALPAPCGSAATAVSLSGRSAQPLTRAEECALKPKDSFRECDGCPEMVVVPAGQFTMGSPAGEKDRDADEWPQHAVTIARPFAVGKFTVTVDQFAAFVADTGHDTGTKCKSFENGNGHINRDGRTWRRPGLAQTGSHPVVCVNWNDAKSYADWLSRKTGQAYRLLSEAEREYVTRAGTTTPFWWGGSISTQQANYDGNYTYGGGPKGRYRKQTEPVDSFAPNPWGLHQVHGNVLEWTLDCWHENYSGAPADGSAWAPGDCLSRVLRGGSWFNTPNYLRSASRDSDPASVRSGNVGFRLVRTMTP
jgi:formylglycine-generating enzyme required for sulfatase activity